MYAGGGEAADQTVRLMLAGCETAVRLGGSGLKNVMAISLALAKNNKQISLRGIDSKNIKENTFKLNFRTCPSQSSWFYLTMQGWFNIWNFINTI